MTSNVGSQHLLTGIDATGHIKDQARDKVMDELKRGFRPEFLNRIDDIIMFKPLGMAEINIIIDLMTNDIRKRLEDRHINIVMTDAAKAFVAEIAYDPVYGARPLKRFLIHNLETEIGKALLEGTINDGDTINVDANNEDGMIVTAI
jgi:ATP-dependent Clp protease ATP-binding subunit ClpB